ncbi:MAG: methyltransferase domain-containing protein [Candidatus Aenigmarchaeota archaeon]|nr:methyltransferase domain-containing protein [Candidatus Aenigmarchaeota archaeon]
MDWRWLTLAPMPSLLWLWFELVRNEAIPIPLSRNAIRKMLALAKVTRNDLVYDLGSGDGRVLIIAAKEFHSKAVGVEKNRLLVWLSRWMVQKSNLQNKIKIIRGDIFKKELSNADAIVMYLSHKLTQKLKQKFEKELKKGTRIVSASHPIVEWEEVKKIKTGHFYSYLYKI